MTDKYPKSQCKAQINYELPINGNNRDLTYFTCDEGGAVGIDGKVFPKNYIYEFLGGKDCEYTGNIFSKEDLQWFKDNVVHMEDCKNFRYEGNNTRTLNKCSENKEYMKDMENLDKPLKYFTCGANGGGYHGKPWEMYRYSDMDNGSYTNHDDREWYKYNVSHIKNCSGLNFKYTGKPETTPFNGK